MSDVQLQPLGGEYSPLHDKNVNSGVYAITGDGLWVDSTTGRYVRKPDMAHAIVLPDGSDLDDTPSPTIVATYTRQMTSTETCELSIDLDLWRETIGRPFTVASLESDDYAAYVSATGAEPRSLSYGECDVDVSTESVRDAHGRELSDAELRAMDADGSD